MKEGSLSRRQIRRDDFGFPVARGGARDPAVPRRDEDSARHAVRNCPVMALRLYDEAG